MKSVTIGRKEIAGDENVVEEANPRRLARLTYAMDFTDLLPGAAGGKRVASQKLLRQPMICIKRGCSD